MADMTVNEARKSLALIITEGGARADAARKVLDQYNSQGFSNPDEFITAVEGLNFQNVTSINEGHRYTSVPAVRLAGPSFTQAEVRVESHLAEAANRAFDNPDLRGNYTADLPDLLSALS